MKRLFETLSILLLTLLLLTSCEETVGPDMIPSPIFSLPSGIYTPDDSLTISCSEAGAEIRYTLDNSQPDSHSTLYSTVLRIGDLIPAISNDCVITATAFKPGFAPSPPSFVQVTISYPDTVATPVISPAEGEIASGSQVTITCSTPQSQIRYTLDGTPPTAYSSLYSGPITIAQAGMVRLSCRGFRQGWNPGPVASAYYDVTIPALPMVLIPAGSFHNGVSMVSLSSYYIDKYEVSQVAFQAVTGYVPPTLKQARSDFPITYVSWFDAIRYCNLRSLLEGLNPCYSYGEYGINPYDWPEGWDSVDSHHNRITCAWTADGYRLPTEMEWVYAAKGGSLSQGYNYSGPGWVDNIAWYKGNSGYSVHSLGLKVSNELGLYDMSGNVREWCWDIFGALSSTNQSDPRGAVSGSKRCLKGGSLNSDSLSCEVSYRYSYSPGYDDAMSFGFRCVRRSD